MEDPTKDPQIERDQTKPGTRGANIGPDEVEHPDDDLVDDPVGVTTVREEGSVEEPTVDEREEP